MLRVWKVVKEAGFWLSVLAGWLVLVALLFGSDLVKLLILWRVLDPR